jgi:hypothetical protein
MFFENFRLRNTTRKRKNSFFFCVPSKKNSDLFFVRFFGGSCLNAKKFLHQKIENITSENIWLSPLWKRIRPDQLQFTWRQGLRKALFTHYTKSQSYQTSISSFIRFSLLSLSVCSIRKYFMHFEMANLNSKKTEKILILRRKTFGKIDSNIMIKRKCDIFTIISHSHEFLCQPK